MGSAEKEKMTRLVCDANVLFKLLVPEEDSEAARTAARAYEFVVPEIAFAEVGNALWSRVQRGEFSIETGQELTDRLQAGAIEARPVRPLLSRALWLASQMNHPIYDCVYLALAESLNVPFLTADQRFLTAFRQISFQTAAEVKPLVDFA
jgi:predicted nucleic acid-binding protein